MSDISRRSFLNLFRARGPERPSRSETAKPKSFDLRSFYQQRNQQREILGFSEEATPPPMNSERNDS